MAGITFNAVPHTAKKFRRQLHASWDRVIDSGIYLKGPQHRQLTTTLEKLFGTSIIPVGSGHDALYLALLSLNLSPTDEVIVPANAYPTAFPVIQAGAKLVLCDVTIDGQIDPVSCANVITKHTKAIVMVHLFGLTGDIAAIKKLCKKHNIVFIEDCAQSFGTVYKGKRTGTWGDIACFSFYPTKNIGALGDGGAIRVKNRKRAQYIEKATQYGEKSRYHSLFVAGHTRIPEIIAAGLNIAIQNHHSVMEKRKKVYRWYTDALKHAPISLRPMRSDPASDPIPHLFVLAAKNRNTIQKSLKNEGILTLVHYPAPIHFVPAFRMLGYKKGDFPIAEQLSQEIVSLPFHEFMTKSSVYAIVKHLIVFYTKYHGQKSRRRTQK